MTSVLRLPALLFALLATTAGQAAPSRGSAASPSAAITLEPPTTRDARDLGAAPDRMMRPAELAVPQELGRIAKSLSDATGHLPAITAELKALREQASKPQPQSYADYFQMAGIFVTLLAAVLSAYWASRSAYLLAAQREKIEARQFCFELQRQFDSPEMFRSRYSAWQKLNSGSLAGIKNVSELLSSEHWTADVSTVIHFFESLSRYCDEGLVDGPIAAKLFGRSYDLWYQGLLGRLELDAAAATSHDWFEGIRAFHKRVQAGELVRPAPQPRGRGTSTSEVDREEKVMLKSGAGRQT
jgi:hypothetical protein